MLTDEELTLWVVENVESIAVIAELNPGLPVPSCPGWTVADLLEHIAPIMAGWYCHNLVTSFEAGDFMAAAMSAPAMPDDLPGRIDYLRAGSQKFARLAAAVDLDAPVWTFGSVGPARFWLLRAATETAIHRWDAEGAVGRPAVVSAERAAASVDETVRGMWTALVAADWPAGVPLRRPPLPTTSLWIRATDSGRAWVARADGGALDVTAVDSVVVGGVVVGGVAPDDVAVLVEAGGNDLMLFLWGRVSADVLAVRGPRDELDAWNLCARTGI